MRRRLVHDVVAERGSSGRIFFRIQLMERDQLSFAPDAAILDTASHALPIGMDVLMATLAGTTDRYAGENWFATSGAGDGVVLGEGQRTGRTPLIGETDERFAAHDDGE